ncbi:hypothetical protein FEM48_Zijuj01G0262100 [Ziziphus jujuba var. spinosa]|uniref:GDSL esterase/lipase 1-like n=1 Tax=Ziziphus jujuba var. spinosa TaxID=714518 RepID=A0A978W4Y1_ZIZJJ|nr:hypothetical protein FEM48_Zijuj01G0262100 [Ziziphus jujuba var. spinosa]
MATTWFYINFLALISPILLIILNLPSSFGEKNPTSLFIFGDSLYDAGNNNYFPTPLRLNHWPYGETYFHFPTGRAPNGRLIPDFIAEYAKLPLIPPYLQPGISYNYGVNFASLGAGALQETNKGSVISLNIQLSYFKNVEKNLRHKLGGEEAKRFLSKAVYIFSIGTNDYNSKTTPIPFHSQEEFVGMVIGNLTNVIKLPEHLDLQEVKVPAWMNSQQPGNYTIQHFPKSLWSWKGGSKVSRKQRRHVVALVHTEDLEGVEGITSMNYVILLMIICSLTLLIPSEKANEQFAKLMWSGNSPLIWPYNLKTLFELQKQ